MESMINIFRNKLLYSFYKRSKSVIFCNYYSTQKPMFDLSNMLVTELSLPANKETLVQSKITKTIKKDITFYYPIYADVFTLKIMNEIISSIVNYFEKNIKEIKDVKDHTYIYTIRVKVLMGGVVKTRYVTQEDLSTITSWIQALQKTVDIGRSIKTSYYNKNLALINSILKHAEASSTKLIPSDISFNDHYVIRETINQYIPKVIQKIMLNITNLNLPISIVYEIAGIHHLDCFKPEVITTEKGVLVNYNMAQLNDLIELAKKDTKLDLDVSKSTSRDSPTSTSTRVTKDKDSISVADAFSKLVSRESPIVKKDKVTSIPSRSNSSNKP